MPGYQPVVFRNAMVIVGTASADISDHVAALTLNRRFRMLDDTRMGITAISRVAGNEEWSAELEIIQDFQSTGANIDGILWGLSQAQAAFPIKMRPVNAARTSDNPEYLGNVFMEALTPMRGPAGELLKVTVPFVSAGSLSRLVTSS